MLPPSRTLIQCQSTLPRQQTPGVLDPDSNRNTSSRGRRPPPPTDSANSKPTAGRRLLAYFRGWYCTTEFNQGKAPSSRSVCVV
eukprot:m.637322 g.637322  ORF g.637322 m.637322 type:complete len:84 (-) comp58319_c0_seq17:30-281(-)